MKEIQDRIDCPYCGEIMEGREIPSDGAYFFVCPRCQSQSPFGEGHDKAAQKANTRTHNAEILKLRTELANKSMESVHYKSLRDELIGEGKAYADCVSIIVSETIKALAQKKEE